MFVKTIFSTVKASLGAVNAHTCTVRMTRRTSQTSLSVATSHLEHLCQDDKVRPDALEPVQEDLSLVATHLQNTFNFAAYVNNSETLKNFVKLGVDLNKIEKRRQVTEYTMKLDFERDVKPHLFFLKNYVIEDELGKFLSKNMYIFKVDLKDLEVRINYLQWKKFNKDQIQRIVTKNPFWLMYSTTRIDNRLGFFQQKFELSGDEVRALTVRQPRIITYELHHINTNSFAVKEEMGFSNDEIRKLLLNKPKLWMMNQLHLVRRFDYIHNVMKISHARIVQCPELLLSRKFRVEQRHRFLERLGRAQYNPTKENYVPLKSLIQGTDVEFCKDIAKCTVDDFNTFLKTL